MQRLRPHDRTGLIELMAQLAPIPAVARSVVTGRIEVLGGFSAIPPGGSGFILQVTTHNNAEFTVAVLSRPYFHDYQVVLVDRVPWENWVGGGVDSEEYSIYRGDAPEKYEEMKNGS